MFYKSSWHKAIALSIFLHIFLWVTTGYLAFREQDVPLVDEEVMELSLIDMPGDDIAEAEPQVAAAAPPIPEVPIEPDPPPEPQPPVVEDDIAEKVVEPVKVPETKEETVVSPDKVNSGGKKIGFGTPPIVLVKVDPVNPPEMQEVGRKVNVVLRMQILKNGLPGKVSIAVPSGYKSINDAAIAAAKKWKFEPAKDNEGRPIVCLTILTIPFTVE